MFVGFHFISENKPFKTYIVTLGAITSLWSLWMYNKRKRIRCAAVLVSLHDTSMRAV